MPSETFASVWNNLKKVPELKKRICSNVQLNDGTVLPFLVTLVKDIYKAYIQSDRNSWDYQISCYNFNGLDEPEAKKDLIKQYNNCLSSIDKTNPWVIDERDKRFIKIIRKRSLENEEKLSAYIDQLLNRGLAKKSLPRKKLKKIRQYLYEIATLACFEYHYDNKILILHHLKYQDALTEFKKLLNEDYKIVQLKLEELKTLQKKIANGDLQAVPRSKNQVNTPTYWEKIEDTLNRNILFKFINTIWDAISSHANLLRWISFTLILFSLPFPNFPLILVIIGSIVGYVLFRFTSFTNKNELSKFPDLLEVVKKDKVLDHIKQEVFNKIQYETQLYILRNQLPHLDIGGEKSYKNLFSQINKNVDGCIKSAKLPSYLYTQNKNDIILNVQLENALIYQKLSQVSPKTQFIASLVTKIMSVTLSAYLISWAASILFNYIGALALIGLISSPFTVGLFILIPVCVFFISHLIKYQSRKNTYQRTIRSLLQESCEFSFIDNKGDSQTITLEKWQKFEFLRKEIQLLELEINHSRENNQSSQESQKLFLLFSDYLKNNDIYKSNYQDKRQRPIIASSVKTKKILSRLFYFSAGAFYGFSLGEQIAIESSLGFKSFLAIISLPMYICRALICLPLIIIHGIANFLTYHLNSRQRNLLFFAEHLDSKLQILEYRRKILSYLTIIFKELDANVTNATRTEKDPNLFTEKRLAYLDLAVEKINSKQCRPTTKFFMSPTRSLTSLLDLSEANETDSCPSLTR